MFNALADDKSIELFRLIAYLSDKGKHEDMTGAKLKTRRKLTRKQFYSRIETLISVGLIKRTKGRYFLTSAGRVMNDIQLKVQKMVDNELKLRAIDSILTNEKDMPEAGRKKLVADLLGEDGREISSLLLK